MPHEIRRARTAFRWVGVIIPLVILGLAITVVLAWLPQLPDPVAMHWSGGGPDGFGPRWTVLVPPLIGVAMTVLFALLAWFAHRMPPELLSGGGGVVADESGTPQWSVTARFLGAVNLGLASMMALVSIGTTGVQRGLPDAAEAPGIGGWVLAGFGLLVALTALGWFLQPRVRAIAPRAVGAAAGPAVAARTTWSGSVAMARSGQIVLGIGVLLMVMMTALDFALGFGAPWILLATTSLLLLLVATNLLFRVRVDARGLQVRSLAGWPNTRIPLADIERVQIAQIDPFAEFGGWGWRLGLDGRRGVVMRKGEALQITREGGQIFVVTVDGAAEAAAVLEGLRAAASERKGTS